MAAPSTGQHVAITIGVQCRFHLRPPPPRPPRLTAGVTVVWVIQSLVCTILGVVYLRECPQQPNIPNYLLGMALIPLLLIPFVTFPCESYAAQPQEHPRGCKACLHFLCGLFVIAWILMGDVWVFSIYQPNYDPKAADGLYCNKTLYTFAFWKAVWETLAILVGLAKFCRGILCYVAASPAPADRDFYGHV